ncbi:hypothetical protein BpHYR1_029712 [Brachionus plicatilis]|uniref:Uncharacterized protein n=1 Tax=Brachionus plicatilis TaxID=10195 RepID=A0A3M7PXH3_BRAPC|nr:hypothetical protein BpHYR1_029712 [Brachionus plicatilis]
MSHNFGLNSKSKMTTSKIHGANFLQKRLNQLPNLFSSNVERDDDQMSCSSSGTAKKEKFRIRNFLSVSTQAHDMGEERIKRKLHHQNLSLNSATKPSSPVRTVAIQTNKHYKSTLKECLSQKNVRRKSSTLNTSCVNFANPCNRATQLSFKSSHLDLGLIQKAARRGSIHFYDNKKKKDQEGDTFRQKLLQLQRLQLEFLESNTQFAYHGANRRKLAFAIMEECDDYVRCHEPAIPRLSHAISSLVSPIV